MKHQTAIRTALEIAHRIRQVNGLYATPEADREAIRIRRAWLFGSTVKGKADPNDVDILLDYQIVGSHQTTGRLAGRWKLAGNAKAGRSCMGIRFAVDSYQVALKGLRRNLKMVRFHDLAVDGDLAHPRLMLYPKNELPSQRSLDEAQRNPGSPNVSHQGIVRPPPAKPSNYRLNWLVSAIFRAYTPNS